MTASSARRLGTVCCLAAFVVLLVEPAWAWNSGGHRLSALIAWERMDERTRSAVSELLRQHPDFGRWQARAMEEDGRLTAFLEAATWPDEIRRDPRFYSAGVEEPTPTQAGFPDMERRQHWHYVDRPLNPGRRSDRTAGELDRRLPELASMVGNPAAPVSARAYALPWLIHLVGDAHQPLHAACRLDVEGESDRGGNLLEIINPFAARSFSSNLHRYWDDLPAPVWLRQSRLEAVARLLAQTYPAGSRKDDPEQWIDESWQLARDHAYPPGDEAVPTLSAEFHEAALAIAQRRVTEAGYRLADLLHRLLAEGHPVVEEAKR